MDISSSNRPLVKINSNEFLKDEELVGVFVLLKFLLIQYHVPRVTFSIENLSCVVRNF